MTPQARAVLASATGEMFRGQHHRAAHRQHAHGKARKPMGKLVNPWAGCVNRQYRHNCSCECGPACSRGCTSCPLGREVPEESTMQGSFRPLPRAAAVFAAQSHQYLAANKWDARQFARRYSGNNGAHFVHRVAARRRRSGWQPLGTDTAPIAPMPAGSPDAATSAPWRHPPPALA